MSQPLHDYFALEAGEFLDGMDTLLAADAAWDAEHFFRSARGVRGSAQVADAGPVVRVAARLEQVARALREGRLPLSDNVRARAVRTVDDLRVLVRGHRRWGPSEEARAEEAVARWTEFADAHPSAPSAGAEAQLFAFARRELDAVAEETGRAAAELRRAPDAREPLRWLLRRMRPVRGLAGVPALAPVAEVLEGIEEQAQEILAGTRPAGDEEMELLDAAREAVLALAAALERGPGAPLPEDALERLRALREERGDASDADVVPIASLFHDGVGPHIVSSPAAPVAGGGEVPEAVVLFLRIEGTGFLDRADALLQGAEVGRGGFRRAARRLATLARAVGELAASYGLAGVAESASRAAAALAAARDADAARGPLAELRAALPGNDPAPPPTPQSEPPAAAESPSSGPDADVVPIGELLLRGPAALRTALELRPAVDRLATGNAALGTALAELWELLGLAAEPAAGG